MAAHRYLSPRGAILALATAALVALPVSALGSGGANGIPRWMQTMMGGPAAAARMTHDPTMARMMRLPQMRAMMRRADPPSARGSQDMMGSGVMGAMMGDVTGASAGASSQR